MTPRISATAMNVSATARSARAPMITASAPGARASDPTSYALPRHLSPVTIVCNCVVEPSYCTTPLSMHRVSCARVQEAIERLHITNIRDRRMRLHNPFLAAQDRR